ncbi:hypothetical protein IWQ57_003931, partial [Coemansia nantahalensis]
MAQLSVETSRSVERSLAAIKETMAQFQAELQAEEEEQDARRAAEASKAAKAPAANGTRKRQRSITKGAPPSKARRKLDSDVPASAPEAKPDVKPDVSNDDIPLQALLAFSPPPDAAAAVAATAAPEHQTGGSAFGETDGDLDALFGGAEGVVDATAGNGSGSGGDTAGGLGLGLGFGAMGDDIEMGIGMGLGDDLDSGMGDFGSNIFGVTDDDFSFFDTAPPQQQPPPSAAPVKVEMDAPPALSEPAAASSFDTGIRPGGMLQEAPDVDTADAADHATHDAGDDPFDDDGMFDSFFGGPATQPDDGMAEPSLDVAGCAGPDQTPAASSEPPQPPAPPSISSPPGMASVLSTTETHVGLGEPLLTSGMDVDLATPVSIRATPAPSVDLLTPTPSGAAAVAKAPAAPPLPPLPESGPAGGAGSAQAACHRRASTGVPAPYSVVRTAFDDIGADGRSWLRDQPTEMAVDKDMGASGLVLEGVPALSLVEKSLTPAAWARRAATRRLQRAVRRGSASVGGRARRLQAWLATHCAKLAYAGGFVPAGMGASGPECATDAPADATAAVAAPGAATASNLQYPPVIAAAMPGRDRAGDSLAPSFISIVGGPMPSGGPTMPGPLLLPLPIGAGSLQAAGEAAPQPPATVRATAVVARWVPLWMAVAGAAAERLAAHQQPPRSGCDVTWAAAFGVLVHAACGVVGAASGGTHRYRAEIALSAAAEERVAADAVAPAESRGLGARLGGLLSLGGGWIGTAPATELLQCDEPCQRPDELSRWAAALQQQGSGDGWAAVVEMLCGWAVSSSLLRCMDGAAGDRRVEPNGGAAGEEDVPWAGAALAVALESFWSAGGGSSSGPPGAKRARSGASGQRDDEPPAASGPLGLARLVALANAAPSPAAKYGGYV